MTRLPPGPSPPPAGSWSWVVAPHDVRRQVLLERAREVIRGPEAPVTPSPRIVDVLGPGVDDGLPAPVRRERDALARGGAGARGGRPPGNGRARAGAGGGAGGRGAETL